MCSKAVCCPNWLLRWWSRWAVKHGQHMHCPQCHPILAAPASQAAPHLYLTINMFARSSACSCTSRAASAYSTASTSAIICTVLAAGTRRRQGSRRAGCQVSTETCTHSACEQHTRPCNTQAGGLQSGQQLTAAPDVAGAAAAISIEEGGEAPRHKSEEQRRQRQAAKGNRQQQARGGQGEFIERLVSRGCQGVSEGVRGSQVSDCVRGCQRVTEGCQEQPRGTQQPVQAPLTTVHKKYMYSTTQCTLSCTAWRRCTPVLLAVT